MNVVIDKDDFTVVGWKIGNIIPDWVKRYEDWNIYIGSALEGVVTHQVNNAGANNGEDEVIFDETSNSKANKFIASLHYDVEAREKNIYDNAEKTEDSENKNGQVINNPYINVKSEHISSNVKTKFDGDADMFDLCGNELKKEISTDGKQVRTS
jgi:hypothetical protein